MSVRYHLLRAEEEQVIVYGATEPPGSGLYCDNEQPGLYLCRRCDAPLYLSSQKFSSHCGWPSFDEQLPGAIAQRLDRDGRRQELLCQRCQAHLGHLFHGEGLTPKNLRYCVNSVALFFTPAVSPEGFHRGLFAAGCFWGVEQQLVAQQGVVASAVGYCGGWLADPMYEEVCSGTSGHLETVELWFTPAQGLYEQLVRRFFMIHDPTDPAGQGVDRGDQYRSAIFYLTQEQKKVAEAVMDELKRSGLLLATELRPASLFYRAEEYHQHHYERR